MKLYESTKKENFNNKQFNTKDLNNLNYLSKIQSSAFNTLLKKKDRRNNANFVKSDESKIETTVFNNQNTLLFTKNNFTNNYDKKENENLEGKIDFSYRFANKKGCSLVPEYIPIKMKCFNHTTNETIFREYFKTKVNLNFHIENFEIFYMSKKINKRNKKYNKLVEIKNRLFIFPTNQNIFTCFQISISSPPVLEYLANLIKSKLKTFIIIFLFLYLWLEMMVFIKAIYIQYGDNFIEICVMPLVSMLVIDLLISFNFMLFITTFILYLWGDYFVNTSKLPLIPNIIFHGFVSPLAFHHYCALRTFKKLIKNI